MKPQTTRFFLHLFAYTAYSVILQGCRGYGDSRGNSHMGMGVGIDNPIPIAALVCR